jgi:hypothetical protein
VGTSGSAGSMVLTEHQDWREAQDLVDHQEVQEVGGNI